MRKKKNKDALGRGLDSILKSPETDITSMDISGSFVVGAIANISIQKIEANPFQPRNDFEKNALEELSASIKELGIIQPITVRKLGYDIYQIISGERRLKAVKMAGLKEIPAFIRVANDEQMLEMALVENMQRENLNPIEVAIGYKRLIEECSLSHEKLSDKVGKKRSTVSNYLRLLKLPVKIQRYLIDDVLTMGHARAIISISNEDDQLWVINETIKKKLSVRALEDLVKKLSGKAIETKKKKSIQLPEEFVVYKQKLEKKFDAKVELKDNGRGKGRIIIPYHSEEDIKRIMKLFED